MTISISAVAFVTPQNARPSAHLRAVKLPIGGLGGLTQGGIWFVEIVGYVCQGSLADI
jgi:hypothetical protein